MMLPNSLSREMVTGIATLNPKPETQNRKLIVETDGFEPGTPSVMCFMVMWYYSMFTCDMLCT
jgi:hypothetical protein